jgi:hypothetical protein
MAHPGETFRKARELAKKENELFDKYFEEHIPASRLEDEDDLDEEDDEERDEEEEDIDDEE